MSLYTKPPPEEPWGFLGGHFLLLLGFAAGLIGAVNVHGGGPQGAALGYAVAAFGVVLFVAGTQIAARVDRLPPGYPPTITVVMVMTPLPAVVSFIANSVGNHVRRCEAPWVRTVLAGLGVYFVVVAGFWAAGVRKVSINTPALRDMIWPLVMQLGFGSLGLFLLPGPEDAPPGQDGQPAADLTPGSRTRTPPPAP